MNDDNGFYTQKGYQLNETNELTASMEDYLEMICRILERTDVVRINELAEKLHVKPSSASKMVSNLKEAGYIDFQKYGYIVATKKGMDKGKYLLYRHDVLYNFLCMINNTDNELDQVEKIEHFINETTIDNLEKLTNELTKKGKNSQKPVL
ncbi:MAG: MarR family transcriptional regulator [Clostridia bacterium]|nr:MarR family transcriptional regulator [Clostridia bacterium]NCC88026.1 MarR family transcriptional regulator [Clostridia bacterium]